MTNDNNAKERFLEKVWPKVIRFIKKHGQGSDESLGYKGGKGWPGPYIWSEDGDVKRIITSFCEKEFGRTIVHNESKIDKFMYGVKFTSKIKFKGKKCRSFSIDIDVTDAAKCETAKKFKNLKHALFIEVKYLGTDAWSANDKAEKQYEADCEKLQWLTKHGFCKGAIAIFIGEGRKKPHIKDAFIERLKKEYPKVKVLVWQREVK